MRNRDFAGHDNLSRKSKKHDNVRSSNIRSDKAVRRPPRYPFGLILFILLPFFFLAGFWPSAKCAPQAPDGDGILRRIDENIGADNKISTSEMIIRGRRATRTIRSRSWIRGRTESFTEYLAPPREEGTKVLKLEDQLWTYTP